MTTQTQIQTHPRTNKHRASEPAPVAFPRPVATPPPAHRASRTPRVLGALFLLAMLVTGLAVLVYRR